MCLLPQLPATMHDPNFCGIDADVSVLCKHGQPAEHLVAFEGMHTGRRFLGCAEKVRFINSVPLGYAHLLCLMVGQHCLTSCLMDLVSA